MKLRCFCGNILEEEELILNEEVYSCPICLAPSTDMAEIEEDTKE